MNTNTASLQPIAPHTPNCCERLSVCFRSSSWFSKTARGAPMIIQGWLAVARAIQSQTLAFFLSYLFHFGERGGHDFLKTPLAQRVTGGFRCLSIFGVAVSSYFLIDSIREIWSFTHNAKERQRQGLRSYSAERKNAILTLLSSAAGVLDASASFGLALAQAGAIAGTAVIWAPYLSMAAASLFCFTIWGHWRSIQQGKEILAKLQQEPPSLDWLNQELHDSTLGGDGAFYLRRHFEIIYREKFQVQICHIICRGTAKERQELSDLLATRITDKIKSHKVKMVSVAISVIATFLLYLGPIFWGFGILGVAALFAFAAYVKDRRSVHVLEKKIEKMRSLGDVERSDPTWIQANFPRYNFLPVNASTTGDL